MRKIYHSFLKECQHLVGIGAMSLRRMAFTAFTFSDGTFIPKGTTAAPSRRLHLDNGRYDSAHVLFTSLACVTRRVGIPNTSSLRLA
ncbi:hypothetical protein HD554DRAFT_240899 [Boletus coccyginus]|nr:hypothetical protein HD554DRAFT_240899 [Boletus coccyginus]